MNCRWPQSVVSGTWGFIARHLTGAEHGVSMSCMSLCWNIGGLLPQTGRLGFDEHHSSCSFRCPSLLYLLFTASPALKYQRKAQSCQRLQRRMWDGQMDGYDPVKDFRTARVPMRHGHRKRLDVPKRGKAALWAEIQGSFRALRLAPPHWKR